MRAGSTQGPEAQARGRQGQPGLGFGAAPAGGEPPELSQLPGLAVSKAGERWGASSWANPQDRARGLHALLYIESPFPVTFPLVH